jgi:hypothetical protein
LKVTVPITLTIDDRVEGSITEEIRWVNTNNPNNTGVVVITARMAGSIWKFSSRRAEMLRRANGMLEAFELPVLHIDPTSGTTPPAAAAAAAAAATTPGSGSTTDDKTPAATPTAPIRADVLSEAQLAVEAATADVSGASVSVTLNPLIVGKLTLQIINYETSNEVDNTSFTLEPRAPALAFRVRCCRAPDVSLRAIAALVAPEGPDAAADSEKRLWLGDVTFRGRTSRDETIRVVVPRAEMATFSVAPLTAKLQFAPESADAVTAGSTNRLTASLMTKNLCTEPTVVVFTRGVANAGANEGGDLVIAFDPPRLVLDPHASSSVTVVVTGHATSFVHFPKRIQLVAVDAELPSSTVTFRVEPPAPRASESGGISSPQPSETGTKTDEAAASDASVPAVQSSTGGDVTKPASQQVAVPKATAPVAVVAGASGSIDGLVTVSHSVDLSKVNARTDYATVPVRLRNATESHSAYFTMEAIGCDDWLLGVDLPPNVVINNAAAGSPAAIIACAPQSTITISLRASITKLIGVSTAESGLRGTLVFTHLQRAPIPTPGGHQEGLVTTARGPLVPHLLEPPTIAQVTVHASSMVDVLDFLPAQVAMGPIIGCGASSHVLALVPTARAREAYQSYCIRLEEAADSSLQCWAQAPEMHGPDVSLRHAVQLTADAPLSVTSRDLNVKLWLEVPARPMAEEAPTREPAWHPGFVVVTVEALSHGTIAARRSVRLHTTIVTAALILSVTPDESMLFVDRREQVSAGPAMSPSMTVSDMMGTVGTLDQTGPSLTSASQGYTGYPDPSMTIGSGGLSPRSPLLAVRWRDGRRAGPVHRRGPHRRHSQRPAD